MLQKVATVRLICLGKGRNVQDAGKPTRIVGLIADPGIAQSLADRVSSKLEKMLNRRDDYAYDWNVEVDPFTLPLSESGRVILNENVPLLREKHSWDYIIYLTDAPHYERGRPVRSVVSAEYSSAILSVPSLGIAKASNVACALGELMHELASGILPKTPPTPLRKALNVRGSINGLDDQASRIESIEGLRGRLLLTVGMIRSNRPWRLVPRLSSAMAGAAATGAFGVFYTSIWSMADYLSSARLSFITVSSVLLLSLWLLFHNRLWEKPTGHRCKERMLVYNIATVLTVALAAAAMYVLLFLALLTASLVVIDQEFLASQLGHPAGLAEYLNLAWLAASLGTLGGAIGSSFDEVESVQRATFSHREYERRNLTFARDSDL